MSRLNVTAVGAFVIILVSVFSGTVFYAASLLLSTELTVLEVMYDSGFNNKSYFFREFSRKYNCTPKAYRERERS